MTKYRLAVEAGIPHATLSDICSGKARLEKLKTLRNRMKNLGWTAELAMTAMGVSESERGIFIKRI